MERSKVRRMYIFCHMIELIDSDWGAGRGGGGVKIPKVAVITKKQPKI